MFISKAIKYKVIERFNRWRLFYLDFVGSNTTQELAMQYPELNTFTPHPDMCCIYLGRSAAESCACNGKINVGTFNIIQSFRLINHEYVYPNLKKSS